MDYQIKNINGINVIFAPMPSTNSVSIEVLVKAGSIYETEDNNGISHFLEHMFFKGGERYKTSKDVSEKIDEIGGDFNAFTADEYAGYYVKVAPEYINIGIDILSDMLVNAKFPADEIEKEKGVVIQEIMMYEDMPHSLVMDKWKRYFYGDNSYGWSTLGPVSNIKKFNQDYLFKHKDSLYTKDNLVITVAGNIQNQIEVEKLITDYFADLPSTATTQKPEFPNYLPTSKEEFYDKKTEQSHLVISAPGFNMSQPERYAASILSIILGGNMSSRLYQEIREKKGLGYYIGAYHSSNSDDGVYIIKAGIDKENFQQGVDSIYEQLQKISTGDITQDEFDKALGYIKGKTKMGIETSDQMTSFLGEQLLLKGEIKTLEEVLKGYEETALNDVIELSKKLTKENLYLYYIK